MNKGSAVLDYEQIEGLISNVRQLSDPVEQNQMMAVLCEYLLRKIVYNQKMLESLYGTGKIIDHSILYQNIASNLTGILSSISVEAEKKIPGIEEEIERIKDNAQGIASGMKKLEDANSVLLKEKDALEELGREHEELTSKIGSLSDIKEKVSLENLSKMKKEIELMQIDISSKKDEYGKLCQRTEEYRDLLASINADCDWASRENFEKKDEIMRKLNKLKEDMENWRTSIYESQLEERKEALKRIIEMYGDIVKNIDRIEKKISSYKREITEGRLVLEKMRGLPSGDQTPSDIREAYEMVVSVLTKLDNNLAELQSNQKAIFDWRDRISEIQRKFVAEEVNYNESK